MKTTINHQSNKMSSTEVLRKTQNPYTGDEITTFLLSGFPWRLLCELNTHRQVTKNTESSRARPVESVIEQVMNEPYIPVWTAQQKGMQGEVITGTLVDALTFKWLRQRDRAVELARETAAMGLHKQDANSYLHPWMRVSVICTATKNEWEHVFELRCHPTAKKCFQHWAFEMREAFYAAEPVLSDKHLVYGDSLPMMAQCAKIASVSYAKHTQDRSAEKWLELASTLISADPIHVSPFQHLAFAVSDDSHLDLFGEEMFAMDYHNTDCLEYFQGYQNRIVSTANYRGWVSIASLVEGHKADEKSEIVSLLMNMGGEE